MKFWTSNFEANFIDWWLRYFLWNFLQVILFGPHWWQVNIGSGNGLVPSGNKPLPEPMLTQIYVTIWLHQATMSQDICSHNDDEVWILFLYTPMLKKVNTACHLFINHWPGLILKVLTQEECLEYINSFWSRDAIWHLETNIGSCHVMLLDETKPLTVNAKQIFSQE